MANGSACESCTIPAESIVKLQQAASCCSDTGDLGISSNSAPTPTPPTPHNAASHFMQAHPFLQNNRAISTLLIAGARLSIARSLWSGHRLGV